MLQSLILRVLPWVPVGLRQAIIGRQHDPSRVATFLHNLLNRWPPSPFEVFTCGGALKGYRMYTDWSRFRSFVYGTWEPSVVRVIVSEVKPGMTVADIGAHIGYYTLLLAKCVSPLGRVISFEPLPDNFTLLRKNVELNQIQHVQTFAEAVFSRNGELAIAIAEAGCNSGEASVVHLRGTEQSRVPAVTLDSVSSRAGCRLDFVKMDVEGAEFDALLGAKETVARFRPKMLIELHHFDGNVAGHPVLQLLASWDYGIQWIDRAVMTSHIFASPGAEAT
jgi:FkbM family methyltransferase